MSIFNLFRKRKHGPAAQAAVDSILDQRARAVIGGHRADIGVTGSPQRLAARLKRLEKSIARAEGERRESLQKEIDRTRAYLEAMREALE